MNKERGKIVEKLKVEEGFSKAGKPWRKQEFVIQTDDKFQRKICFGLFGDKIDLIHKLDKDEIVDVQFSVESREFNGRWFHSLNAYAVDLVLDEPSNEYKPQKGDMNLPDDDSDLPF